MNSIFFEKQNLFCSYCMNIDLSQGNWHRYRFLNDQFVQQKTNGLVASEYFICCLYQKKYSRNARGNTSIQLFRNHMQVKALNACLNKIDDIDYLMVINVLKKIKETYPNLVIYIPRTKINRWGKYKIFHLQTFAEKLHSFNLEYFFDATTLPNTNSNTIAIFELSSNAKSIDNNISTIVNVYKKQPPNLLYISLFTEVGKDGRVVHFKNNEIGKMFKQI